MTAPDDNRSATATAFAWASRVMTTSFEMVLPGVLGIWVDRQLGTGIVFTLLGFASGLTIAIWHLLRMTKPVDSAPVAPKSQDDMSDKHGGTGA